MRYFLINIFLSILFIALLFGYNFFSKKEKYLISLAIELRKKANNLNLLKKKYNELYNFIEKYKIHPVNKEQGEKEFLSIIDILKETYNIKINEYKDVDSKLIFKIKFDYKYKNKKELKYFFDTLFNKYRFYIPSVEEFDYSTKEKGTEIKSSIKVLIPYIE